MRVLTADPPPAPVEELLERRRRAGADRLDEVWDGVLHMAPDPARPHGYVATQLAELLGPLARAAGLVPGISSFNLGEDERNFRVPDGGVFRDPPIATWNATAALAIEIVSPGDDSWNKFEFFAAHHVDEVLIVDPRKRSVDWFALHDRRYQPIDRSHLIDLASVQLAARIDWPPIEDDVSAAEPR